MKMKYKYWMVTLLLVECSFTYAQTPGFDDDVQDVPINQWVVPMLVLGAVVLFFVARKKQTH
jgi:hypothetical protein